MSEKKNSFPVDEKVFFLRPETFLGDLCETFETFQLNDEKTKFV